MHHDVSLSEVADKVTAELRAAEQTVNVSGEGNGPISAFISGIADALGIEIDVLDYSEHALTSGASAQAVAYVETRDRTAGHTLGCRHRREHRRRELEGRRFGAERIARRGSRRERLSARRRQRR